MQRNVIFLWLMLATLAQATSGQEKNILFIVDGSGSMWGDVEGEAKIKIVQRVLSLEIRNLAPEVNVGLMTYGQRREGDCGDVETLVEVGPLDKEALVAGVRSIHPRGKSPIAAAIELAADQLRDREGASKIVLLTDGKETCDADPCGVVKRLAIEIGFVLQVVSFGIVDEKAELELECMAKAGRGEYAAASRGKDLSEVVKTVVTAEGSPQLFPIQINTEIVLDLSAAMERSFAGTTRIGAARQALEEVLGLEAADLDHLALRRFGGPCDGKKINPVVGFGKNNSALIRESLSELQLGGQTTLIDAVTQAAGDFDPPERFEGVWKRVVIIAGGTDPCYRLDAPSILRQKLENRQIRPQFRFIGIDIPPDEEKDFLGIAKATGGEVFIARSLADLKERIGQIFLLDPVINDFNLVRANLNDTMDLLAAVAASIADGKYEAAAAEIVRLRRRAEATVIPLQDLSRRKSDEELEKLFGAATELRRIQLEMIGTIDALLAHHRSRDPGAYNKVVDEYEGLRTEYSRLRKAANDMVKRLRYR